MEEAGGFVDELAEYLGFLQRHLPFSELPRGEVARVVKALEVTYHRSGARIFGVGERLEQLYVVRKGAVELADEDGALISREGEGECFGFPALLTGGNARREARCLEDTLLYAIPEALFHELRHRYPKFDRFFGVAHEERLRSGVDEDGGAAESLFAQPVRALLRRAPVFIDADASVREAARRMADHRIASVLVGSPGRLVGILTDRDLRSRVLAAGLGGDVPVGTVMTERPHTLEGHARCLEALLTMTRHRVHHLPIEEGGQIVGVVSASDLLRLQAAHPVYVVGDVQKQETLEGLVTAARRLPGVVQRLTQADLRAGEIARVVTFVADALTERLVQLALRELGPAPAPFAWVALGSQARCELGLDSDQDNGLVLGPGAEDHAPWFAQLAERVTAGLAACGFPKCPDHLVATTEAWRQPSEAWERAFFRWIDAPDPRLLRSAAACFDMRVVHGDAALVEALRRRVLAHAQVSPPFAAALARAALEHHPPIGFFRQFVLDRGGAEGRALDLKHRGLVPIVDLARVHALASGSPEVETRARIEGATRSGALTPADGAALLDAHAFVAQVRLRHQARQLAAGVHPDHFVSPNDLTSFERAHLRDCFKVVETLQRAMERRYGAVA